MQFGQTSRAKSMKRIRTDANVSFPRNAVVVRSAFVVPDSSKAVVVRVQFSSADKLALQRSFYATISVWRSSDGTNWLFASSTTWSPYGLSGLRVVHPDGSEEDDPDATLMVHAVPGEQLQVRVQCTAAKTASVAFDVLEAD